MRTVRHVDIVVATLHMTIAATVTVLVVSVAKGSFVLPLTATGWGGLLGVAALQSGLTPVYFAGIARIGALKSGMIANIQPVTSIVAAFLLFGEWLTPVQLLGGAMVIAGILIMQRHDAAGGGRADRTIDERMKSRDREVASIPSETGGPPERCTASRAPSGHSRFPLRLRRREPDESVGSERGADCIIVAWPPQGSKRSNT